MIFVTVGTQEPFDRLIIALDEIAPQLGGVKIVAQVSNSSYTPENIQTIDFISPLLFNNYFKQAKLIISHAGMGTIISALEQAKPILVFPRLAKLKEHRNDHQLATARAFEKLNYIYVAYNEKELKENLVNLWNGPLKHLHKLEKFASQELINSIHNYVSDQSVCQVIN